MAAFKQVLAQSRHIVVLAGSGLSAASGLPTFRGSGGLWRSHDAMKLATTAAFAANPSLVWSFYFWRMDKALNASPNAGHRAIGDLMTDEQHPALRQDAEVTFVTQNVDAISPKLHDQMQRERGNTSSDQTRSSTRTRAYEMHGSLNLTICTGCKRRAPVDLHDSVWDSLRSTVESSTLIQLPVEDLPHCSCGSLLRPGVVWFGEQPCFLDAIDRQIKICDLVLVVGTSNTVYPAAGYAREAQRRGAKVAVFNIEELELLQTQGNHRADFLFIGPCQETLPQALTGQMESSAAS